VASLTRIDDNPLVSIVTPSYNQGRFIETTLLSVKKQDYPNIEHIVVDGGSTDHTLDVLGKHRKEYNLKWISEPDKGQSDAVNKGFDMASGEIIGWLNSDDVYFDRQVISNVVSEFRKMRDVDILYGDGAIINERDLILGITHTNPQFNYSRLLRTNFIFQPASFFKRRVIQKDKLDITIDLPMDYEYYLRLAKAGYVFKHVNRVLAAFRVHKTAKSSARADEMRIETKKVRKLYGCNFNAQYYLLKLLDGMLTLFLKEYGVKTTILLAKNSNKHNLAFPANFSCLPKALIRQLAFDPRGIFR